jgi:hypothetical protein
MSGMVNPRRPSGRQATNDLRGRTSRDEGLLREVRWRLAKDQEAVSRLRRLERMEQTARLWVNGEEVGGSRFGYLGETHD